MELEAKTIKKKFGKKIILENVSFSASRGTCVGILGKNGSGKSTLLSILAGILKCDGGQFLFEGKNIFENKRLRTQTVGYVPQGTPLFEELTAWDNLLLWYDKQSLRHELQGGVLGMLGIDEFLKTPVHKLSGGMKKRLSIGCSIAQKPPVLLLDEPGASLDLICKEHIAAFLSEHKSRGGIIILTSHDQGELELCDSMYILRNGQLEPFSYDGNIHSLAAELER